MKSMVLEVKSNEAVILSDDGTVSKIRNNNYSIGQVISLEIEKKAKSKFYTFAASFVAAMIILTVGAFAYFTPVSYVSLDVNPSIEYSINLFDRVLSYKSVNEDGKEIIETLDLKNKKIAKALEETLNKIVEEGYITKAENAGVVISVSDSSRAKVLVNEIREKTEKYLAEMDETAEFEVDVDVEAIGRERVNEARKLGITPGKLNLIGELRDSTDNSEGFVMEDWLDKSVKEINKAIKENRKSQKADDSADDGKDDDKDENNAENAEDVNDNNANKPVEEKNKKNNKDKNNNGKTKDNNNNGNNKYDDKSEKEKNNGKYFSDKNNKNKNSNNSKNSNKKYKHNNGNGRNN